VHGAAGTHSCPHHGPRASTLKGKTLTTIAAVAVVALLVVVALARLASIVAYGVSAGRTYVASRSVGTPHLLSRDGHVVSGC